MRGCLGGGYFTVGDRQGRHRGTVAPRGVALALLAVAVEMYGDPPANWQGLDLSNDHPIAMTYPTNAQDPLFNTPLDPLGGWPDVPLFDGKVECASCPDVHDPGIVPFMRTPNTGSAGCLRCLIK